MFVREGRIVTSASDLIEAATCEFSFLRACDETFGRNVTLPPDDDAMRARAATLGDAHESRQLHSYIDQFGSDGVVQIDRPKSMSHDDLSARAEETLEALQSSSNVVFQATFYDPEQAPAKQAGDPTIGFVGFADFLVRRSDGVWEVQDTKLARRTTVRALLQLAAYAEQLERLHVPVSNTATLLLGDGTSSRHDLRDISPVFRSRRQRMIELLAWNSSRFGPTGRSDAAPVPWGAPGVTACGRCVVCEEQVEKHRDPLLIAGIRSRHRDAFVEAGFATIDQVADLHDRGDAVQVPGLNRRMFDRLSAQAALQVAGEHQAQPQFRVIDPEALTEIPPPSDGDLFFDFEGDPLFRSELLSGKQVWGIDYLFGVLDCDERFTPFWAHTLAEERQALVNFMDFVEARQEEHPDLHIYHYAPYERTHLLSIAARHGVCEDRVDNLLRNRVLVDLYGVVRKALLVGERSYSIKKLEPLYMGDEHRDEAGVTTGADSVSEYALAAELMRSESMLEREEGQQRLETIADYNRYDCLSTLRLRDWLLLLAENRGVSPRGCRNTDQNSTDRADAGPSNLAEQLQRAAEQLREIGSGPAGDACGLASSAIDYHRREQKSFWWAHYERLATPLDEWADTRDVFVVDGPATILEDWHLAPRARKPRRTYRLEGTFAPGSHPVTGTQMYAIYEEGALPQPPNEVGLKPVRTVTIDEVTDGGVTVSERVGTDESQHTATPVALTPGPPPNPGPQVTAIEEWGETLASAIGAGEHFTAENAQFPRDAVVDLLLRKPPELESGTPVRPDSYEAWRAQGDSPTEDHRIIGAVTASLLSLQDSYLAVQGPPGTGKTYLGSHVIRILVEQHGWTVGVVAQSHRVVEHMLDGVVKAGLDASLVGKTAQRGRSGGSESRPLYTTIRDEAAFLNTHRETGSGAVIGGTAWLFSNPNRVERRSLDLLVIDEAGQFSLAPTIASSVSAKRLLLLGDPQQLPQVSQGTHPEPVNESALGWIIGEHDTIDERYGYFLTETRRMRPELARVVSALSYEGKLSAHQTTQQLRVPGVGRPGLTWHPVTHTGNTTSSKEEAHTVVEIVRSALQGRLSGEDIIIVAAFNAQVECVKHALERAGLNGIRVGTVDAFQGQEATISIVTLAASSPEDIPRGIEFLLMPNRLNVAISRAKWGAHLVSSATLGGVGLPTSVEATAALSGYLRLTEEGGTLESSSRGLP